GRGNPGGQGRLGRGSGPRVVVRPVVAVAIVPLLAVTVALQLAMWLVGAAVPVGLVRAALRSRAAEVRRRGAQGSLHCIADGLTNMAASEHGDALAKSAAQRGQVITQSAESFRRVAHRMGEQWGRAHGRISLGWAKERRASQGVRGGS